MSKNSRQSCPTPATTFCQKLSPKPFNKTFRQDLPTRPQLVERQGSVRTSVTKRGTLGSQIGSQWETSGKPLGRPFARPSPRPIKRPLAKRVIQGWNGSNNLEFIPSKILQNTIDKNENYTNIEELLKNKSEISSENGTCSDVEHMEQMEHVVEQNTDFIA